MLVSVCNNFDSECNADLTHTKSQLKFQINGFLFYFKAKNLKSSKEVYECVSNRTFSQINQSIKKLLLALDFWIYTHTHTHGILERKTLFVSHRYSYLVSWTMHYSVLWPPCKTEWAVPYMDSYFTNKYISTKIQLNNSYAYSYVGKKLLLDKQCDVIWKKSFPKFGKIKC